MNFRIASPAFGQMKGIKIPTSAALRPKHSTQNTLNCNGVNVIMQKTRKRADVPKMKAKTNAAQILNLR